MGSNKGQLLLEYEPASPQIEGAERGTVHRERWNSEQIGDFVRKLGFVDKSNDKEGDASIKHFLNLNQVSA